MIAYDNPMYNYEWVFVVWLIWDAVFNFGTNVLFYYKLVSMSKGWYYHEYNIAFLVFTCVYYASNVSIAIYWPYYIIKEVLRGQKHHKTCCIKFFSFPILLLKIFFWMMPTLIVDLWYISFLLFKGFGLFTEKDRHYSIIETENQGNMFFVPMMVNYLNKSAVSVFFMILIGVYKG